MLNAKLGATVHVEDRPWITTRDGAKGHAVYGPYELRDPGHYAVRFTIRALSEPSRLRRKAVCAVIEVTGDGGDTVFASEKILAGDLANGQDAFVLPFDIAHPAKLEYRVWTSGKIPLLIDDNRPVIRLADGSQDPQQLLRRTAFPGAEGRQVPFFDQNRARFWDLYRRGCEIRIENGRTIVTIDGVSFNAIDADDLFFVDEIFTQRIYDFQINDRVCVIDIGLNIGLSSLFFATKAEVVEVHSFEPFPATYHRALANIALNQAAAKKITAANVGLSDRDWTGEVLVPDLEYSGALSTLAGRQGTPIGITLRDAGDLLGPIIDDARRRGLKVIVKVDCEGSEYAVFASLARNKLLARISGFMVEWHAVRNDMSQRTLTAPLRELGYLIYDRSPPGTNGFFYAANLSAA